ncbi:purine-nucleoside phosphorylase [Nocardiopsis sp. ARC36]
MGISHITADEGVIADFVLMPGDPLRGRRIAEELLDDPVCHNEARNMLGFTGSLSGIPVSVQASGMGAPSATIYATELFVHHGVHTVVRVGTCAALTDDIAPGDLVIASGAATDSRLSEQWVPGVAYAPTASFPLLAAAERHARARGHRAVVGQVMSSDVLYGMDVDRLEHLSDMGVLGLDMETAALYGTAARHGRQALSVLTVSDNLRTRESLSAHERETCFGAMSDIASDLVREFRPGAAPSRG